MDNGSHLDSCSEDVNHKYFTSLCTVFVATIQEAKDRISQLESIFCSQLFPTFQSELTKYRNVCKRLEKIKEDAEEEWRHNRRSLLMEVDKLQTGRKDLEEQVQMMKISFEQEKQDIYSSFVVEKEELVKKHGLEKEQLFSRLENVQSNDETLKLQEELQQRLEEITEGKLLHEKLLQQVSKMDEELKVEKLRQDLQASELEREKKFKQDLVEQFRSLKRMYKGLRAQYDVVLKLNGMSMEKNPSAKKKVQNDSHISSDTLKHTSLYGDHAEGPHDRGDARMVCEDKGFGINPSGKPMEVDVNSNRNLKEAYHQASSSFGNKFKLSQNGECGGSSNALKNDADGYLAHSSSDKILGNAQNKEPSPFTLVDSPNRVPLEDEETQEQTQDPSKPAEDNGFRAVKEKNESLGLGLQQKQLQKRPLESKSWPPNISKRNNSSWKETRLRKEPGKGVDPHDDFLDTPMETLLQSVKRKLEASSNELENKDANVEERCPLQKELHACQMNQNHLTMEQDTSDDIEDDETQDIGQNYAQETSLLKSANLACNSDGVKPVNLNNKVSNYLVRQKEQNRSHIKKGYKYIEPVRKKADREALKGVECNQCKKFYDAVVGDNDANANSNNRCEHHKEVSRHRYRYVPPATPEGFWNIGFDSDL